MDSIPADGASLEKSRSKGQKKGVVVAALILVFSACSGEKTSRTQAQALLERISSLDIEASFEIRERQLRDLEVLPLRDPQLAAVRDQCLAAHRGLLRAEVEQDAASSALESAAAQYGDAGIPPVETEAIAARIRKSSDSLAEAQHALPDCDRRTLDLVKRAR